MQAQEKASSLWCLLNFFSPFFFLIKKEYYTLYVSLLRQPSSMPFTPSLIRLDSESWAHFRDIKNLGIVFTALYESSNLLRS